jgi:hypothetical protein
MVAHCGKPFSGQFLFQWWRIFDRMCHFQFKGPISRFKQFKIYSKKNLCPVFYLHNNWQICLNIFCNFANVQIPTTINRAKIFAIFHLTAKFDLLYKSCFSCLACQIEICRTNLYSKRIIKKKQNPYTCWMSVKNYTFIYITVLHNWETQEFD